MWQCGVMNSEDARRARPPLEPSTAVPRRVQLAAATTDLQDDEAMEVAALTELGDAVLGALWRNANDQIYDDL